MRIKHIIINVDDFGMCSSINHASIEAVRSGCATSLSVMPCAPFFNEAVRLARKNKITHMGVHLCLNSEFPGLRWGTVTASKLVPSLVDCNGYMHKSIKAASHSVCYDEVMVELENQILKAIKNRIIPTHLDCHMFVLHLDVSHRLDLLACVNYLCKKYRLPFRAPFRNEVEYFKKNNTKILVHSFKESYDIEENRKVEKYNAFIRSIGYGVSELILHCGYDNVELKKITKCSGRRQADLDYALSAATKDVLKQERISVISWRQAQRLL